MEGLVRINKWSLSPLRTKKDVTDKGKLFERIGRKATGLLNGGWVTEVISGNCPFFLRKEWVFLLSDLQIARIVRKKVVRKEFQKVLSRK